MGPSRFYAALAALLFTAACAWSGAAVFRCLDAPDEPADELVQAAGPCRFRGLVLRRERTLDAPPDAESGQRLSAAETGTESGLYFPEADSLSALTPEDAAALSAAELDRLLAAPPETLSVPGRLVCGEALVIAAFARGDLPGAPGSCRVTLASGETLSASLLEARPCEDGRSLVLLRLPLGHNRLLTERFVSGEILLE